MPACSPQLSCGNMRSNVLCVKTRWLHESPGLVIMYFVRLPNRTFLFVSSGETVRLCMGESENPNLRLRSRLELWSRSWHGWFLEHSFLVRNLFYNDTCVDFLFRGWNGDRSRRVVCLIQARLYQTIVRSVFTVSCPSGKTGVTADRDKIEFRLFNSSSIFNITLREELFSLPKKKTILSRSAVTPVFLHHAVRLWRSPRRWPRGATNPVQIRWKSHVSSPLSWGRWPSLIRRNR